ncbi:tail fiber assembly protein [Xenorhabdus szentirmaii]|uniref:tail fiber assembly protein n=1 Tax=Xenorhabdus szentirmaii TaxID=290112 RepID=UPI000C063E96|nr:MULTISPECIES: tail fiber assembly protein [unclassified Xenorhabdus]PHM41983.1 tail assembly chaperone [Xenorhabdus szentirmaii]
MMKYKYSDNEFYPYALKQDYIKSGIWPDDGIDVDETVFKEYTTPQSDKIRVMGNDGMPAWDDIPPSPPPTLHELQQHAEHKKQYLMSEASNAIAPLQYAVDLKMATNEEQSALMEWKKYYVLLNRIDCSKTPNIDWPEAPK